MSTSSDSAAASFGPSSISEQGCSTAKRFKPTMSEVEMAQPMDVPSANSYQKSFLHRNVLLQVASSNNRLSSASSDGHVTCWKRDSDRGLIPEYHVPGLGRIVHISINNTGTMFCALGRTTYIFDAANSFDSIAVIALTFRPSVAEWITSASLPHDALAIASKESPVIGIYGVNKKDEDAHLLYTIENLFSSPVLVLKFNPIFDAAIGIDRLGAVQYFSSAVDEYKFPKSISWKEKSRTDLTLLEREKVVPLSIAIAPSGVQFALLSGDHKVRVFDFAAGVLLNRIDDSLGSLTRQNEGHRYCSQLEFNRRSLLETEMDALLLEKELGQRENWLLRSNLIFDPTGEYLIYATLLGIKVVRWVDGSLARYIGSSEKDRFLQVSLCRGDGLAGESAPALIATAFQRQRIFLFVDEKQAAQSSCDERDVGKEESLIPVSIQRQSSAKSASPFHISPTKSSAAKRSLSSSSSSSVLHQPASPEPIVSPIQMLRDLVPRMPSQMFSEIGPIVELLEKQAGESKKKISVLESRLANLDCRCVIEELANHTARKHSEWHEELADVLAKVHDERACRNSAVVCLPHFTMRDDIRRRLLYPHLMLEHFNACDLFPEKGSSIAEKLKAVLDGNPIDTRKLKIFDICDPKFGWRSDEKYVVPNYSATFDHFRSKCDLFKQPASGVDAAYFDGLRDLYKNDDVKVMYGHYCKHVHRSRTTVLYNIADHHADMIKRICDILPDDYKFVPVSK